MTKTLDATDNKIIALLRENARLPLVALAKKVGLSRSSTQERLKRLEQHKVIARYTVQFGPSPQSPTRAWLILRFQDGFRCADVVPHVLQRPEVRLCHSLAGDIDLLILIEAHSISGIADVRESIAGVRGVAEVQSAPVLTEHFDYSTQIQMRSPATE